MLGLKDSLFFLGLVCAGSVSLYKLLQLPYISQELKELSPECAASNPQFFQIFIGTLVFLKVVHWPIVTVSKSVYMNALPTNKYPLGSKARNDRAQI